MENSRSSYPVKISKSSGSLGWDEIMTGYTCVNRGRVDLNVFLDRAEGMSEDVIHASQVLRWIVDIFTRAARVVFRPKMTPPLRGQKINP